MIASEPKQNHVMVNDFYHRLDRVSVLSADRITTWIIWRRSIPGRVFKFYAYSHSCILIPVSNKECFIRLRNIGNNPQTTHPNKYSVATYIYYIGWYVMVKWKLLHHIQTLFSIIWSSRFILKWRLFKRKRKTKKGVR